MSQIDVKKLMAYGCSAQLATLINALISKEQDIDTDDGITFNTAGSPFTIRTFHGTYNGQRNDALSVGYNVAGGGYVVPPAKITSTEPAFALKMESHYVEGGTLAHLCEVNFDYISPDGAFNERAMYWSANRVTNATYSQIQADSFDLLTPVWRNSAKFTGIPTYLTCTNGIFEALGIKAGIGTTPLAGYGVPNLIVGNTNGDIYQQGANINHFFDIAASAANNRIWATRVLTADNSFHMAVMDDAGTIANDFLRVIRSGTTVTKIGLPGGISTRANNAAALAAGLAVGDLYKTGADPDVVCIVH